MEKFREGIKERFIKAVVGRTQEIKNIIESNSLATDDTPDNRSLNNAKIQTNLQDKDNVIFNKQDFLIFDLKTKNPISIEDPTPHLHRMYKVINEYGGRQHTNNFTDRLRKSPIKNPVFATSSHNKQLEPVPFDIAKFIDDQLEFEAGSTAHGVNLKDLAGAKANDFKIDLDALSLPDFPEQPKAKEEATPVDKDVVNLYMDTLDNNENQAKNTSATPSKPNTKVMNTQLKQKAQKIGKNIAEAGKNAEKQAKNNPNKSVNKPKKKTNTKS